MMSIQTSKQTEQSHPKAIIFDLGGVIIDIDFNRVFERWAQLSGGDALSIQERFTTDDAYRRHERGELSPQEYFSYQRELHGLSLTDEQMLDGWNAIFGLEIQGVRTLIKRALTVAPCAVFSNTNAAHQAYWAPALSETLGLFDQVFVSNELGLRKPDAASFRAVCAHLKVDPSDTLFFDDTQENLDGALALGIESVKVSSPDDIDKRLSAMQA